MEIKDTELKSEIITPLVLDAWTLAKESHLNKTYGDYPYIFHLESVVDVLLSLGYAEEEILICCVLHDIIEDTSVTYNEIKDRFGKNIAEIVYSVTDELGRTRKESKHKTYSKIRKNKKSIVVKLCDRISNIEKSILYDSKKLKMYLDEDISFKKGIYNESTLDYTRCAWEKYNELIESVKNIKL